VDSLLYFAKNTEQLAGTLCHEVSHTIHWDSMALTRAHILVIALKGDLHSLGYSREAESNADVTGRTSAQRLVTIRGAWFGCFRHSKTQTRGNSRNFFPIIQPAGLGFKRSRALPR
jgi:hypothetical protein